MGQLDRHFGEDTELDSGAQQVILKFLLGNYYAGKVKYGLPNKIMAVQRDRPATLRKTQMRYFVHEHNDLPKC